MSLKPFTTAFFKVLTVVAACLALCATIGCSGSPATLEEYFDAHPDVLQSEVADFESALSGDEFAGSNVEVKDNHIIMTGALNIDLDDFDATTQQSLLTALEDYLKEPAGIEAMVQSVKNTEEATGIEGITITIAYTDKNGRDLTSATYGSGGIV